LFQPEYKLLRKGFEEQLPKRVIMNLFENQNEIEQEQISPSVLIEELTNDQRPHSKEPSFHESPHDVTDLKELSPEQKNLMILDDLLLQK